MKRIALISAIVATLAASPALSAGEVPFEKVKGWDIERSGASCLMSKSYKDKDDNNAENAIIFALAGEEAIVSLIYQHWTWDKDEKVSVPLALDKRVVNKKSAWSGDGQLLNGKVPASLVPNMLAAKALVLKFEDSDADFDLSGFAAAYESLRRCDAAPTTSASMPSEAVIKTFYLGAMVEAAIKECDVPTTGKQRTTFDARMAGLRKEMGGNVATIQSEVDKRPEPRCPKPEEASRLTQTIDDFNALSPEEFFAKVERRTEEAKKAAAPKP